MPSMADVPALTSSGLGLHVAIARSSDYWFASPCRPQVWTLESQVDEVGHAALSLKGICIVGPASDAQARDTMDCQQQHLLWNSL